MSMTKKHFQMIADAIADTRHAYVTTRESEEALGALDALAENLAHEFADENPRFDRDRFLDACKAV